MKYASNRAEYYKIDIPEKFCGEFFPNDCTLYVSFCKALPVELNLCNNDNLPPSSVCVTNGTTGYSLGEYNQEPFERSELYFGGVLKTRVLV